MPTVFNNTIQNSPLMTLYTHMSLSSTAVDFVLNILLHSYGTNTHYLLVGSYLSVQSINLLHYYLMSFCSIVFYHALILHVVFLINRSINFTTKIISETDICSPSYIQSSVSLLLLTVVYLFVLLFL